MRSRNLEQNEKYAESVSKYLEEHDNLNISPENLQKIADFFEFNLYINARNENFSISDYLVARIPDFLASISSKTNQTDLILQDSKTQELIKTYLKEKQELESKTIDNNKEIHDLLKLIKKILTVGQKKNIITETKSFQDLINEKIKDVLQRLALIGIPLEKLENLSNA